MSGSSEPPPGPHGDRDVAWPVYLVDSLDGASAAPGAEVALDGPEGRHAVAVRRHRPGDQLVLSDGNGRWVTGPVVAVSGRDRLTVAVTGGGVEAPPEPTLTVAQALPKSDRADEAVELLTEVGADEIVGWQATRSIARWTPDRAERGLRRWRRTAAEAAKQSRRVRLPVVTGPESLAQICARVAAADVAVVCHERAEVPLVEVPMPAVGAIVVVVGPEGGLTDDEVGAFTSAGAAVVGLGPTVLRTVAAGAVAATLALAASGRLAHRPPVAP